MGSPKSEEIPKIKKVPMEKELNRDKELKKSSGNSHSYRGGVNFRITT